MTTVEAFGDAAVVVTVSGEVDAYSAPTLRLDLRRVVEEDGANVLVIDLSAVTFLDSSGLGAIVGALRRLSERGGQLRIVEPRSSARRIFELTRLDTVLELYADREAALNGERG